MLLAGCGRIGFDAASGPAGIDAAFDATDASATIDAPTTAMMTMISVARDTYISNEAGEATFNYGGDNEVRLERDSGERGLLSFDLASIPATATIFDVSLGITVIETPPAPTAINLHEALEAWDEGTLSGSTGLANYTMRNSGSTWTTPGAGTPGSASSTIAASFTPVLGRQSIVLPDSLIQQWVQNPATNHGIVLISTNDDSSRFTTSEGLPVTDRPVLTVTFVP